MPAGIRQAAPLDWGPALSEQAALHRLRLTAAKNQVLTSLIGQGYHGTVTPPVIQRNILENPAWYTAYTPYQPEISQGRLEALLNFQTMVCDLTGLDVANASLLDEATAAAEAMALCQRAAKSKATAFFVDRDCHPQTIDGDPHPRRAARLGGRRRRSLRRPRPGGGLRRDLPVSGHLRRTATTSPRRSRRCTRPGALACVAADPLALTLLKPPGEMGADIAVGSTQRFGVPLGYGGPHAAYMAVRDALKRSMPGRIVGVSIDARGNRAYRLALQTREQHIRREKATSNVCTAQALLAVMASMYAVFHGPEGLKAIAQRIHRKTVRLAKGLESLGFTVEPAGVLRHDHRRGRRAAGGDPEGGGGRGHQPAPGRRRPGSASRSTSAPGASTRRRSGAPSAATCSTATLDHEYRLPEDLVRTSDYLTHPIFHMNRAEAEMTRYMRRLADRDLALDRAMIPLGSCTMKLNATAEMMALSWPEFADIHPFAPSDQTEGYAEVIGDLCGKLCAITGYDAFSMQPNSGAQGEYAGLLTIRAYHASRGEGHRDVCLIPTSAHGTNPASAQMAGMKVVAVEVGGERRHRPRRLPRQGRGARGDRLAACMITYPSTHGVFEETVREVCEITHAHGGQVYLDGANMNALVGLARPGDIGSDVSHLNLHKTFCIPHGGGGPGMGPIGVKAHLAPFLPGRPGGAGRVSAADFGSPSLLTISWAYCLMMGGAGLTQATKIAILNANYIAARLSAAYPILYSRNGRVAHECIVDTRPLKERAGVTRRRRGQAADRLRLPRADDELAGGGHADDRADRERAEGRARPLRAPRCWRSPRRRAAIERGEMDAENNPLKHAPHTVEDLVGDWDRPYSREAACYPPGAFRVDKYWAPVNRVDNAWGDRNLVCSCPPMESYSEAAE